MQDLDPEILREYQREFTNKVINEVIPKNDAKKRRFANRHFTTGTNEPQTLAQVQQDFIGQEPQPLAQVRQEFIGQEPQHEFIGQETEINFTDF